MAKQRPRPPAPQHPLSPPPLTPSPTSQFKKDVKRMQKRGRPMEKLRAIIDTLLEGQPLSPQQKDHALVGEWQGCRDCHIEPDWVLIYERRGQELLLHRTG